MTLRAATYCRISDDRGGQGLGVERQRQDCDALVTSRGWESVAAFTDNDVSAYSGKPRPGYARLLEAVRAGRVDVIVAWHPDRLHRSPRELEDFIEALEAHVVHVETVQSGRWDLSTASGRLNARVIGAVSRGESEHRSARVRRALQQRAESGRSHGRRPYGWTADGAVDREQAVVVAEAARRIVAGDSLRGIVADLNAREVPAPSGKPWGKVSLRHLVLRERNVGLLVRHGQVIREGEWPPILDRGLWEQTRAVLSDPTRRTSTSSAAAHLLSGIARCGVCGGSIRAGKNRTVDSYRCAARSCVSRTRADVDALVTGVVLGRLALPDAAALLRPERREDVSAALDEADELRARLDNAADDYADGKIDSRQLERITARLRPRMEAAQVRARRVDDSPLLDGLIGADNMEAAWLALPLTRRRAVVDLLLAVTVNRTAPGARDFDPDAIDLSWR